ncbi:MAG: hypothetical protein JSU66_03700 [Deltaproteobacteria bacterium]|nr:MAG: hypothetical protein JSU66_03700 [Deltaproteobacteria bacterium]
MNGVRGHLRTHGRGRTSRSRSAAPARRGAVAVAVLAALGGSHGGAAETRPLRYALCRANVVSAEVVPGASAGMPFGIAVRLAKAAAEDFSQLTEANVGNRLEIVFANWLFARAPIRARIRSGVIINQAYASRDQANGALRELTSKLPDQPCGAVR